MRIGGSLKKSQRHLARSQVQKENRDPNPKRSRVKEVQPDSGPKVLEASRATLDLLMDRHHVLFRGIVYIDPRSYQRMRMSRTGRVFTPNAYAKYKREMAEIFRSLCPRRATGRLVLHVEFHSATRQKRDCDNLLKSLLDSGNGILWVDDSQIDAVAVFRVRSSDNPRTEIVVMEA